MTQRDWLQIAECLDALRVFPRLFMLFFTWLTGWVVYTLVTWYMGLPAADRAVEASGFAAFVITSVSGLWTAAAKIYVSSGRRWKNEQQEPSPE